MLEETEATLWVHLRHLLEETAQVSSPHFLFCRTFEFGQFGGKSCTDTVSQQVAASNNKARLGSFRLFWNDFQVKSSLDFGEVLVLTWFQQNPKNGQVLQNSSTPL